MKEEKKDKNAVSKGHRKTNPRTRATKNIVTRKNTRKSAEKGT